jgi:hypothetical protein
MHACIRATIDVSMYVCIRVHVWMNKKVIHTCMHVRVSMHVILQPRMRVYMCSRMCTHVWDINEDIYAHIHTHTRMHVYVCMPQPWMRVCMRVLHLCIHVCIITRNALACRRTHIHAYMRMYVSTFSCMCVFMYACILTRICA